MPTVSPVIRISFSLVLLTACILLTADLLGLTPGRSQAILESRKKLCETLAVQFALSAQRDDWAAIKKGMAIVVERNPDVLSAGLRTAEGQLIAESGEHRLNWTAKESDRSTPTHARVPLFKGEERWGSVEVRFRPITPPGVTGAFESPLVRLLAFTALAGFFTYLFFMRRTLKHLDPSSVIPGRVKAAFDVMTEGLVLLDQKGRIVLANQTFCSLVGEDNGELMGRAAGDLDWIAAEGTPEDAPLPWVAAMERKRALTGSRYVYVNPHADTLHLMVNAAPVMDGESRVRGALATFADLTDLQESHERLELTLVHLEQSRDEIARKNDQLQFLASRDPLTGLLNRRSFFERFESVFNISLREGKPLACIMCDIDHFKRVNDNHGHAVGDEVIQLVAETLKSTLTANELICRYGGEEFCIVLPGVDVEDAALAGEQFRIAMAAKPCPAGLRVTSSVGVSALSLEAGNPGELIDQADKALYVAKQLGRNRVVRWDQAEAS